MSSLAASQLVGGPGANNQPVWVPLAFSPETGQAQVAANLRPSGASAPGDAPQTPPVAQPGQPGQYVSALFVEASCDSAVTVGSTVRAGSSATTVSRVTSAQPFPAIGVIVSKASDTRCLVQTYGLCTALGGLVANSRYFVGPDGAPTLLSGLGANAAFVQPVGFATGPTTFFVQPTGIIYQRAAVTNAAGQDITPSPSATTQSPYYGGVLFGIDMPADDLGQKGDSYFQYLGETDVIAFGPKSDAGWGTGRSLRGPAGNRNYVRQGPPDPAVMPAADDCWFDVSDGNVVFYAAS